MNKYSIRFNKTRGQPGRGTVDHVWRVFENDGKEYLCKHINIKTEVTDEVDKNGQDHNIVCYGTMTIDRNTSTISIASPEKKEG